MKRTLIQKIMAIVIVITMISQTSISVKSAAQESVTYGNDINAQVERVADSDTVISISNEEKQELLNRVTKLRDENMYADEQPDTFLNKRNLTVDVDEVYELQLLDHGVVQKNVQWFCYTVYPEQLFEPAELQAAYDKNIENNCNPLNNIGAFVDEEGKVTGKVSQGSVIIWALYEDHLYPCTVSVRKDTKTKYQKAKEEAQRLIDELGISNLPTRAEQALAVHDYLARTVEYDLTYIRTYYEYSALFEKKAVCNGYAKTFKLFMNLLNIPCEFRSGDQDNSAHAWNIVQMDDGKWYYVDVTQDRQYDGSVSHRKFLVDRQTFIDWGYKLINEDVEMGTEYLWYGYQHEGIYASTKDQLDDKILDQFMASDADKITIRALVPNELKDAVKESIKSIQSDVTIWDSYINFEPYYWLVDCTVSNINKATDKTNVIVKSVTQKLEDEQNKVTMQVVLDKDIPELSTRNITVEGAIVDNIVSTGNGKYELQLSNIMFKSGENVEVRVGKRGYTVTPSVLTARIQYKKQAKPDVKIKAVDDEYIQITNYTTDMQYSTEYGQWYDLPVANSHIIKMNALGTINIINRAPRDNMMDSLIQVIDVEKQNEPYMIRKVDCTSNLPNGKITVVNNTMEYRHEQDNNWTICTGSEVDGLYGGTYYVRYRAYDDVLASSANYVTIEGPTRPATQQEEKPNAIFTATGADCGILSNVTEGMMYSLDGGNNWIAIQYDSVNIQDRVATEYGIYVVKKGTNDLTVDSEYQFIAIEKAAKPKNIGKQDITVTNPTGKITGVTSNMEYRCITSEHWITIIDTQVEGLVEGKYLVRMKANGTVLASDPVEINVVSNTAVSYTINATAEGGGRISPNGIIKVDQGKDIVITITPDKDYVIDDVIVDGISKKALTSYTFSKVNSNHTIHALFKVKKEENTNGNNEIGGANLGGGTSGGSGIIDSGNVQGGSGTPGPFGDTNGETVNTENDAHVDREDMITEEPKQESTNEESDNKTAILENAYKPTEITTTVKTTITKDTLCASITNKEVTSSITKAKAIAEKNGTIANGIIVEFKVENKKAASNLSVKMSKASINTLINEKITKVKITGKQSNVMLDLATMKEIQKQSNSNITLSIVSVKKSILTAKAKKTISDRPAYELCITDSSGKKISQLGKKTVVVSIPYNLGKKETASKLCAYRIDHKGNSSIIGNSVYDSDNQCLIFITNLNAKFAVGYSSTNVTFSDIKKHWAKESIEFVTSRGLLIEKNTKFMPNSYVTQKELLKAFNTLSNKNKKTIFTSYKADQTMTREQFAKMVVSYIEGEGIALPKKYEETIFNDQEKISVSARSAVKQLQMAGILVGKKENKFDPTAKVTRAQVSALLKRLIDTTVDLDKAERSLLNDSGEIIYD